MEIDLVIYNLNNEDIHDRLSTKVNLFINVNHAVNLLPLLNIFFKNKPEKNISI